jgi:hypothetical protein
MNMIKFAITAAVVACLALAGCQTAANNVDQAVQKSLPAICQGAATAKPVLMLLIDGGKIKAKDANAIKAAYASLEPLCADPSTVTAADVLVQATVAYLTISTALKNAQSVQ